MSEDNYYRKRINIPVTYRNAELISYLKNISNKESSIFFADAVEWYHSQFVLKNTALTTPPLLPNINAQTTTTVESKAVTEVGVNNKSDSNREIPALSVVPQTQKEDVTHNAESKPEKAAAESEFVEISSDLKSQLNVF